MIPLIKSMTGYGRGEEIFEGRKIAVEIRSVNNRFMDCVIKMPKTYIFAEDAVRSRIQSSVVRGRIDVFITIEDSSCESIAVTVNEPLARSYISAMQRLILLIPESDAEVKINPIQLAGLPDVLTAEKKEADQDTLKKEMLTVVDLALKAFNAMRAQEGEKLKEDILKRAETIESLLALIEQRSPETVREYQKRLLEKMNDLLQDSQIDEARILTEAAIFADKVAVDEETVRLHSHLSLLRDMMNHGGEVGRKLDFLIQEFNREANTIGSKCVDLKISHYVVDMKAEIEKIREQVQNLE